MFIAGCLVFVAGFVIGSAVTAGMMLYLLGVGIFKPKTYPLPQSSPHT